MHWRRNKFFKKTCITCASKNSKMLPQLYKDKGSGATAWGSGMDVQSVSVQQSTQKCRSFPYLFYIFFANSIAHCIPGHTSAVFSRNVLTNITFIHKIMHQKNKWIVMSLQVYYNKHEILSFSWIKMLHRHKEKYKANNTKNIPLNKTLKFIMFWPTELFK